MYVTQHSTYTAANRAKKAKREIAMSLKILLSSHLKLNKFKKKPRHKNKREEIYFFSDHIDILNASGFQQIASFDWSAQEDNKFESFKNIKSIDVCKLNC